MGFQVKEYSLLATNKRIPKNICLQSENKYKQNIEFESQLCSV